MNAAAPMGSAFGKAVHAAADRTRAMRAVAPAVPTAARTTQAVRSAPATLPAVDSPRVVPVWRRPSPSRRSGSMSRMLSARSIPIGAMHSVEYTATAAVVQPPAMPNTNAGAMSPVAMALATAAVARRFAAARRSAPASSGAGVAAASLRAARWPRW